MNNKAAATAAAPRRLQQNFSTYLNVGSVLFGLILFEICGSCWLCHSLKYAKSYYLTNSRLKERAWDKNNDICLKKSVKNVTSRLVIYVSATHEERASGENWRRCHMQSSLKSHIKYTCHNTIALIKINYGCNHKESGCLLRIVEHKIT